MNEKMFLTVASLFYALYGFGLVIAPAPFLGVYNIVLNADGVLVARLLGAALLGFTFIFWQLRNSHAKVVTRVMQGSFLYSVVGLLLGLSAMISGVAGPIGWFPVALYALRGAGFGYCGFVKT